jgi:hypothetical protein
MTQQEKAMKLVRNLAATLFLACALTVTVYAGDQQTPGIVPPPPPPATSLTSTTDKASAPSATDGKVQTEIEEPEDLLVSALLALLSVF